MFYRIGLLFGILLLAGIRSGAQTDTSFYSSVDLPVRNGLNPLFDWAERSVDTVFTSPGYPDGWVQPQCDLRYRYRFWRGPLQLKATAQTLDLGFTGYYQIEGSSRGCFRGTILTPWTPSCRCGFDAGARRVDVRFLNTLSLLPRYQLRLQIQPQKPVPKDKCSVCFWGQDITDQVMAGLWEELTAAQRSMESSYGRIDLAPLLAPLWDRMNQPINLGSYGWLLIRPAVLRINRMSAQGDSLDLSIGLSARPVVLNAPPGPEKQKMPADWDKPSTAEGFRVRMQADLRFDSLSQQINHDFLPIELSAKQGPFRKKIRIDSLSLEGSQTQQIQCRIHISGKYAGTLLIAAVPHWDASTGMLTVEELAFDIQTRHKILGAAAEIFDRPIRNWIQEKCQFRLQELLDSKRRSINEMLKQTGNQLIQCRGELEQFRWIGSEVGRDKLRMVVDLQGQMRCQADLSRLSL